MEDIEIEVQPAVKQLTSNADFDILGGIRAKLNFVRQGTDQLRIVDIVTIPDRSAAGWDMAQHGLDRQCGSPCCRLHIA